MPGGNPPAVFLRLETYAANVLEQNLMDTNAANKRSYRHLCQVALVWLYRTDVPPSSNISALLAQDKATTSLSLKRKSRLNQTMCILTLYYFCTTYSCIILLFSGQLGQRQYARLRPCYANALQASLITLNNLHPLGQDGITIPSYI